MAITDTLARVLVLFKGDTSDLKAKIKDLQGVEKEYAEQQLKRIEETNKGLDTHREKLGRVGIALNAVKQAVDLVGQAWTAYADKQRLAAQAGAVDLDRLSKAAGGTRTQMQLLADAAKLQQSAFRLSGSEMEMVERAMRQLTRETGNTEEVTKKVTEAIVKLEGESLKDYGIRVREASTDSEKFAAIMEALTKKAGDLRDENLTAAESLAKVKAGFGNAADTTTAALGRLVDAMSPMLDSLARAVGIVADLVEASSKYSLVNQLSGKQKTAVFSGSIDNARAAWRWQKRLFSGSSSAMDEAADALNRSITSSGSGWGADIDAQVARARQEEEAWRNRQEREQADYLETKKKLQEATDKEAKAREAAAEKAKKAAEAYARIASDPLSQHRLARLTIGYGENELRGDYDIRKPEDLNGLAGLGSLSMGLEESRLQTLVERTRGASVPGLNETDLKRIGGAGAAVRKSQLEQVFGPISEFSAYQRAFAGLTGAVQGAFGAWIDGSKSASEAFKELFAASLKGMATDLLGKAIQHGVYALGSLAFGDVTGAATHGKAAAAAAAGAAAIGVLAKALHGGSDAPTGPGAGAGGPAGGGGGGGAGGTAPPREGSHTVLIVGDPHAQDSPRRRGANFRRQLERVGLGNNGVSRR